MLKIIGSLKKIKTPGLISRCSDGVKITPHSNNKKSVIIP